MRWFLGFALFCALAATATPATADVGPDSQELAAIDGSDLYGYTEYMNRGGWPVRTVLWRRNLPSEKRIKLASFPMSVARIRKVAAGGGRVAMLLDHEPDYSHFMDKIVVFNRDGSRRRVIARGTLRAQDWNDELAGCGSFLALQGATSSGSFVVSRYSATRSTSYCGHKPNIDRWKYVEFAADGSQRTIYSSEVAVKHRPSRNPLAEVVVSGDYAAMMSADSPDITVKNLATNVTTGPFLDSVRLAGKKLESSRFSLGPAGMIAIESDQYGRNSAQPPQWMDVFTNPLLPSVATRSPEHNNARFCGSHLIDTVYATTDPPSRSRDKSFVELSPSTLAAVRTIATFSETYDLVDCVDDKIVISRRTPRGSRFRVLPIPPG